MSSDTAQLAVAIIAEIFVLFGFVWWVFITFYRRDEAAKLEREIRQEIHSLRDEAANRSNKIEIRMDRLESSIREIAVNTSYIKGKIEKI